MPQLAKRPPKRKGGKKKKQQQQQQQQEQQQEEPAATANGDANANAAAAAAEGQQSDQPPVPPTAEEEQAAAAAAAAATAEGAGAGDGEGGAGGPKLDSAEEMGAGVGAAAGDASAADRLMEQGIITTFAASSKAVHANTRDINVQSLTVTFHGRPLLEDTELVLNYGNRYGFLGPNGSGKSTFMKVIAARALTIPDGLDIFHLTEEVPATDVTALAAVMAVDTERQRLEAEAERLNDIVTSTDEPADDDMEALTHCYERLDELDAETAEARASMILAGLGFTPSMQQQATREFSGGWRMRISLARALFIQPEVLLLDEPTAHLDLEAVVWLEDYLSKWNRILFLVSHSQDFMNNVCTHIVQLHQKKLKYFTGNYDAFVRTRAELEENQMKRYNWEQDQMDSMKTYIARFGHGTSKMARQAQSKEKTLAKMVRGGLTEKVVAERVMDFRFPHPDPLPPPVLQCQCLSFRYPGGDWLYRNVDFGVDLDSRIALVGPNGAGKTTLVKLLCGELQAVEGDVRRHSHLRMSRFTQHFVDVLDLDMTPLQYMRSLYPDDTVEELRQFLGRYGVSGPVQTTMMAHLSDGQKSRVVFAKMAKENPSILMLDEPTNALDAPSIDALSRALNDFSGGVVLVSHDMRLISQVAEEIYICDNQCVTRFNGNISDFKMHIRAQLHLDDADAQAKVGTNR